ncbi:hypothetical protein KAH81_03875 [bacterium]|nr:hypothetical protein [bacterium]
MKYTGANNLHHGPHAFRVGAIPRGRPKVDTRAQVHRRGEVSDPTVRGYGGGVREVFKIS